MVSFSVLDDNGTKSDDPLDPEPKGLLLYAADGCMSVSIIRRLAAIPSDSKSSLQQRYMIYAGTWRHVDNQVIHTIAVAQDPQWVNTEQVRDATLDGDRLTLSDPSLSERRQHRVLEWQRITTGE